MFQFRKGELRIQGLTFEDAGMYQCIAENTHGIIYANAELKIVGESDYLLYIAVLFAGIVW